MVIIDPDCSGAVGGTDAWGNIYTHILELVSEWDVFKTLSIISLKTSFISTWDVLLGQNAHPKHLWLEVST